MNRTVESVSASKVCMKRRDVEGCNVYVYLVSLVYSCFESNFSSAQKKLDGAILYNNKKLIRNMTISTAI